MRLPAWTERSRSRSPGASSTHSAGSSASDSASAYAAQITTHLNHLPAGRFVYGRRHLQPFEFSAFWHSAESNRAGTRPARSPEDEPVDDSRDGDAETSMAWGRSDAHGRARQSTRERAAAATAADSAWRIAENTRARVRAATPHPPGARKSPRSTLRRDETNGGRVAERRRRLARGAPRRPRPRPSASRPPSPSSSPSSSPSLASDDARVRTWPDRRDVSVVAERASFVDFLRENLAVSTCVRTSPADRIGDLASQTRAWGGAGVAGRTPRAKRRARTLAATKRRDGGAHEGSDVAGHVARVRRRVRRARRGKRKGKEGRRGKGGGDEGSGKPRVWGGRLLCIDTLYQ